MYRTVCIFWYHSDRYLLGTGTGNRFLYRLVAVLLNILPYWLPYAHGALKACAALLQLSGTRTAVYSAAAALKQLYKHPRA